MAKRIAPPSLAAAVARLKKVSLRNLGLLAQDFEDLRFVGISSIGELLREFDSRDGDLTGLSSNVLIDSEISDRVGDLLISQGKVLGLPEEWLKEWETLNPKPKPT